MVIDKTEKRLAAQKRRHALRDQAIAYKGGCCEICRYKYCRAGLEFHHIDDLSKEFSISDRLTSWDRIVKELDKCALLCCRCHREVHDGLHPTFLALNEYAGRYDDDRAYYEEDEEECEF